MIIYRELSVADNISTQCVSYNNNRLTLASWFSQNQGLIEKRKKEIEQEKLKKKSTREKKNRATARQIKYLSRCGLTIKSQKIGKLTIKSQKSLAKIGKKFAIRKRAETRFSRGKVSNPSRIRYDTIIMRRIISMSRRRTCTEEERWLKRGGERGGPVESTRWPRQDGDSANPLYTLCQVDLYENPYERCTHNHRAHMSVRLYTRHTYAPLVLGIVITGSARNHSCWSRKSLRIRRSLAFPTRNIYNHSYWGFWSKCVCRRSTYWKKKRRRKHDE